MIKNSKRRGPTATTGTGGGGSGGPEWAQELAWTKSPKEERNIVKSKNGNNKNPGFRVQGSSGFRVQGSGFRVQGSGFRVRGLGVGVQGSGFRATLGHRCVGFSGFTRSLTDPHTHQGV